MIKRQQLENRNKMRRDSLSKEHMLSVSMQHIDKASWEYKALVRDDVLKSEAIKMGSGTVRRQADVRKISRKQ